ncbi:MAG TPA: glycosyltransferase family 2 protein [Thermoanaerobaculia bacterium]|nr:glycosyltransferase family 2 protein [Thermoanaerobaculia bacterium]HXT49573.1 glycosyltransferase family 2 protein [Thermoanaerobaculia bacterium]
MERAASNPGALPRVAAIVVNYDGKQVTLDAVASLRRMRYPRFDLVVLDNGSRDGSVEALAAAFPDLRQLRLRENRGSASGYAAGFRWAFANGYDYALLLNNDVEVEPDMLDELVAAAERDPKAGAVGPKCYFHGERRRLWSAGGVLRWREAVTRERGYGELDHGQFDQETAVDYVNGCAILVRREAAEAAGGWDPLYFICVDDADFCTRLAGAGWRCIYAPKAVLYHRVAWTTGGYAPGRNFQLGRSSALYVRRYAGSLQKARFWAFALAALVVGFLRELPRRNQAAAVAKLRGALTGWREPLPPAPRLEPPPAELGEVRGSSIPSSPAASGAS